MQWALLGFLTLLGGWVRLLHIDIGMRYDEAFTVWRFASRGLLNVLGEYTVPNNHVLHTLLVWGTAHLLNGWDPWIVRLPAFLAGVALIPTSFAVFGRLAGVSAGFLSAAFITGSSVLIDYSVNARGYTLAGLLGLVALWLAFEVRRGEPHRRLTTTLGLVGALGLWTVPVFAYVWGSVLLWIISPKAEPPLKSRLATSLGAGLISVVGTAALYLPILIHEGFGAVFANRFVRSDRFDVFLARVPDFLGDVTAMWLNNMPIVIAIALASGFLAALMISTADVRWLAISIPMYLGVLFVGQHVVPYPRNWLVLLPVVFGISACGIASAGHRLLNYRRAVSSLYSYGSALVAVWMVGAVLAGTGTLSGQSDGLTDAEQIVFDLQGRLTSNDRLVAVVPAKAPLAYYAQLYQLPDVIEAPNPSPDQLFVVTAGSQTVAQVLELARLPAAHEVELLAEYPSGSLWRVVR